MKSPEARIIEGELNAAVAALRKQDALFHKYAPAFADETTRDVRDAVLLGEIFCNVYTCMETVFLRISRAFENHLDADRWHKELLRKMRMEIPRVRPPVISQSTYEALDELRRFRHFRRYYYDFEYDWDRLDYLSGLYRTLMPGLFKELETYTAFLKELSDSPE